MPSWVSEATEASFQTEVLERSHAALVMVDFWAEWCGPCRTLTPTLESVVEGRGGSVQLVKVNVDQCPNLSAQFGIRGIPAVKAFHNGQQVGEFVGVRGQAEIEQFIDGLLPSEAEEALGAAADLLSESRFEEALAAVKPALEDPTQVDAARLLVAQIQTAQGNLAAALVALTEIGEGSPVEDQASRLRLRIELLEAAGDVDEAELNEQVTRSPNDLSARWALAGRLLQLGKNEQALEELLEIVRADRKFRDDGARRALLSVFDQLGHDSDLAREFRRRLQIYV